MSTSGDLVVGIDVGGEKKGFHVAAASASTGRVFSLFHGLRADIVSDFLKQMEIAENGKIRVIAIDSPCKPYRESDSTRAAEKELRAKGYRIFWTPKKEKYMESLEHEDTVSWMTNGGLLFSTLQNTFPGIAIVETFPTAVSDRILSSRLSFDVSLLYNKESRKHYGDYIDSVLAASSAISLYYREFESIGDCDEQGPVILPRQNMRTYTLAIIFNEKKILLGKKKRGFGKGLYNGFGGKLEDGETLLEGVERELHEEAGIRCMDLKEAGSLDFTFTGADEGIHGIVFCGSKIGGEIQESDEMAPVWFDLDNIPYDSMWEDDRLWLPAVLRGYRVRGSFHFSADEKMESYNLDIY